MMSGDRLRDEDAAEMLASMALELARKKLAEEASNDRPSGSGSEPQSKGTEQARK